MIFFFRTFSIDICMVLNFRRSEKCVLKYSFVVGVYGGRGRSVSIPIKIPLMTSRRRCVYTLTWSFAGGGYSGRWAHWSMMLRVVIKTPFHPQPGAHVPPTQTLLPSACVFYPLVRTKRRYTSTLKCIVRVNVMI